MESPELLMWIGVAAGIVAVALQVLSRWLLLAAKDRAELQEVMSRSNYYHRESLHWIRFDFVLLGAGFILLMTGAILNALSQTSP